MSVLIAVSMSFMRTLVTPPAMMSKACTIGTPDCIMVANWRLKIAISRGVMRLPAAPNRGLALGATRPGVMPCLRSSALSRLAFLLSVSPLMTMPRLSLPDQTKVVIWLTWLRVCMPDLAVAVAMA